MSQRPNVTITLTDADNTTTVGHGKWVAWENSTTLNISLTLPDCVSGRPTCPLSIAAGATTSAYHIPPGQAQKGYTYNFTVGPILSPRVGTINVD